MAGAALAPQAAGFEIFGFRLFEDQADRDADAVIADPHRYTLTLLTTAEGALEAAIRNASMLHADRDAPASGAAGLIAKARGDYRRITAALYGEGHYGGAVRILLAGAEADTLAPDARLPDPTPVEIHVDPGPVFHFGAIAIRNAAPPAVSFEDEVASPQSAGFVAGGVARSAAIARAEALALEAWRQQGHAKARIADRQVVADHSTRTLDVVITVDPGPRALFGPIRVEGAETLDPGFIAWMTGLEAGAEYDPDALALAQRRLDRLEVFRAARFEPAETVGPDGLLPFTLFVQEQAGRRFGVGATYSTLDGFGVEAYHLWRNLFGRAERLRLDARVASIAFPLESREFDYFFGGTFTMPGLFTPDTDLIAAVSLERTLVPRYKETSAQARIGLGHVFSDEISVEGGLTFEIARFEDDYGIRDFTTLGAYGIASYDTRDDALNATEGYFVSATIEPFYEFNYANAGVRAILEGRTYFAFGENDDFVLAARVRAAALIGPSLEETPPDRLFFAGGGGSVRGYGYKSIGVEGPGGVVSGGRYLLEASLEARARVTESIGVVGFIDGGYVAADTFPGLEELRLGAGIGVRYDTGLGPLRLDLAIPLNPRPGDPGYAIYAGIGQAF